MRWARVTKKNIKTSKNSQKRQLSTNKSRVLKLTLKRKRSTSQIVCSKVTTKTLKAIDSWTCCPTKTKRRTFCYFKTQLKMLQTSRFHKTLNQSLTSGLVNLKTKSLIWFTVKARQQTERTLLMRLARQEKFSFSSFLSQMIKTIVPPGGRKLP